MRRTRILFITWDGPQTQYLGRLFLPILARLASDGYSIAIMQFSSSPASEQDKVRKQCEESGVELIPFPVSKFFGKAGQLFSIVSGSFWLTRQNLTRRFDVVIVRSILPAIVYLFALWRKRTPLVFDADGLPIEQRLEFEGLRPGGFLHRILQMVERATLDTSSSVISRSKFGTETLMSRASVGLIDKRFFEHNNGVGEIPTVTSTLTESVSLRDQGIFGIVYVGSWGSQYRPNDMLHLVKALRQRVPNTVFSVFSGDTLAVESHLKTSGLLDSDWVRVSNLKFDELQPELGRHSLGLAFRQSSETSKGVYPLKVADYLWAGLPVVGDLVGGMEPELRESGAFWDVRSFSFEETVEWCEKLWLSVDTQTNLREICLSLARNLYSLDRTADAYRRAVEHASSHKKFSQGMW